MDVVPPFLDFILSILPQPGFLLNSKLDYQVEFKSYFFVFQVLITYESKK